MKIHLCVVGKLRNGPEKNLIDDYLNRFEKIGRSYGLGSVSVVEVEDKKNGGMSNEAILLQRIIPKGAVIIALDERGEVVSSPNFSEKLICLDYLPMYYYRPIVKNKISKNEISKNNIYSCPQTLQKIHPEFDLIIGGILKQDRKALIYFIKDMNNVLYKKLLERFKKNKEIDLNRVKFLDGLNWEQYVNHCGGASVLLDPIYYGAGNSFYESLFYGTPTVSMPTKYTKARLVLGAYNQIDISDMKFYPIVNSSKEYISKSIEIANEKNLYELKKNIELKAKKNLYENEKAISNLEKILKKIAN